jgi:uncharacterized membrane protein YbhN (UPF0104 family)
MTRLSLVIRIVALAAIAFSLWWFIRQIDLAAAVHALTTAHVGWLVVAVIASFACLGAKAVCWQILLAPRHDVPLTRLWRYEIAANAASAIAPARAGEVLRVWTLKRRDGVPAADTTAIVVAGKNLEYAALLLLVAPVPWLLPRLPSWVGGTIAVSAAIVGAVLVGFWIATSRVDATRSPTALRRFIAGMGFLRNPRRLVASVLVYILMWAADLATLMAVLRAVDLDLSAAAGLLILFGVAMTVMWPSTPAQVGAFEVGALTALDLLHVDAEAAFAFALLYHLVRVVPVLAVGLILEMRLVLGRDGVRSTRSDADPEIA